MDTIDIIRIILEVIVFTAAYGGMVYFIIKGNLTTFASELIAIAEKTGLPGSEKMAGVVGALYEKVPAIFKRFLTKEKLEAMAQLLFDWMRKYAKAYLEAHVQGGTDAANEITKKAAVELISSLVYCTLEELKDKASEYGINAEGLSQKEIVELITEAVINRTQGVS